MNCLIVKFNLIYRTINNFRKISHKMQSILKLIMHYNAEYAFKI